MNFVYPLGSGSIWEDNELLYSIKSVRKNFVGEAKIIVIGETPRVNVGADLLVKCQVEGNRYQKAIHNFETAAKMLNDPFVMMNDDFFCLKKFTEKDILQWYDFTIKERITVAKSPIYQRCLSASIVNKNDLNFAVHRPMLIEYLDVFLYSCEYAKRTVCSLRNYYGNKCFKDPVKIKDIKLDRIVDVSEMDWFSISDKFVSKPENKEWLSSLM